jgi:hypothetical protein
MTRATVTACIIARDEERLLPACLTSVGFCDEIVVVDSGSTDRTRDIARDVGAVVVEQPWLGFAGQRNVAMDHATSDWILEIDADERVSQRLRDEIESFLSSPPADIELCAFPSRDVFLGRPLGPSSKYPRYRHRLFRRGALRHDERRTVHEGLVPRSEVHPFEGDLVHLMAADWREAVEDAWRYARLEAGQLHAPRRPIVLVKGLVVRPAVKLAYRLSVDGGWRDGWQGVVKIGLDCATDQVVWARHALGLRGPIRGHSGVPEGEHYGSWLQREGNARVAAVAVGAVATSEALEWARGARAADIDVVVISDRGSLTSSVPRVRPIARPGPLPLLRALGAEEQLRPVDAVVAFGTRAERLLRLVPARLRGRGGALRGRIEPRELKDIAASSRPRDGRS